MSRSPPISEADLRLFLQQLQVNPVDVSLWPPALRISLLRNSTLDLTNYDHRVISVPRLALMAVSPAVLAAVAKHPEIPAINFTFDLPSASIFGKKASVAKMDEQKIKWYTDAFRAFAHWLTALCTPAPIALAGCSQGEEMRLRHICRVLDMESYAQHLTQKFINQASSGKLTAREILEMARSCHGADDPLLKGLAAVVVKKKKVATEKMKGEIRAFLGWKGTEQLKAEVERLENAGAQDKKREIVEIRDDDAVEVDKDGWQVFPGMVDEEVSPSKKWKVERGIDEEWEIVEID